MRITKKRVALSYITTHALRGEPLLQARINNLFFDNSIHGNCQDLQDIVKGLKELGDKDKARNYLVQTQLSELYPTLLRYMIENVSAKTRGLLETVASFFDSVPDGLDCSDQLPNYENNLQHFKSQFQKK